MTFLSEPTAIKRSLPLRSRSILLRSILLVSTCPRLPPSKKFMIGGTDKMPCLSCSKMKETRRRPQGDRGNRGRHGKARTAAAPLRQLDRFIRLFAKSICRNEKAGTDLRAVRCWGDAPCLDASNIHPRRMFAKLVFWVGRDLRNRSCFPHRTARRSVLAFGRRDETTASIVAAQSS
jgi:hypothetical protein